MKSWCFALAFMIMMMACQTEPVTQASSLGEVEQWRLGWRMIVNTFDEDYDTAAQQFDSLLTLSDTVDVRFLIAGLEVLENLGQLGKRDSILSMQQDHTWKKLCEEGLYQKDQPPHIQCEQQEDNYIPKKPALQRELIVMKVRDQWVRGNIQDRLIEQYQIDTTDMNNTDGLSVDAKHREQLKAIIAEHGFPTTELIGKDGMGAVFILIQHVDGDPEWQKAQLPNIEAAVKRGDLDGQDYAYLYDRIQINADLPQRYGTQFTKVDPGTKTIELAEVEDPENLNQRRMEVGLMPIETYRALVLSRFQ